VFAKGHDATVRIVGMKNNDKMKNDVECHVSDEVLKEAKKLK